MSYSSCISVCTLTVTYWNTRGETHYLVQVYSVTYWNTTRGETHYLVQMYSVTYWNTRDFSMWQSTPVPDNEFLLLYFSMWQLRVHLYQIMSYYRCTLTVTYWNTRGVTHYLVQVYSNCHILKYKRSNSLSTPVPDNEFLLLYISVCDRVHLYQIMSFSSCISVCDS
jgi:hypothetical protein